MNYNNLNNLNKCNNHIDLIIIFKGKYQNIAVIIGSEGGFSPSECDKLSKLSNVKFVTLGKRILRAETASIVATALAMDIFEQ